MAPRLQYKGNKNETPDAEHPKKCTVYAPRAAVLDSDSYWYWPSDQVDVKDADSPVDGQSEACSTTVHTAENNSVSSIDVHDYWAEECCDQHIETKYFLDYSRDLGRGTNSVVRPCVEIKTGKTYAVKTVKKWNTKECQSMKSEANLLRSLDHCAILKVHDQYEDPKNCHVISELCSGGELYEQVSKRAKQNKCISEDAAARIVQQIVEAISYCHKRNVVHRDIKLENVLLLKKGMKDDCLEIRLADFGLATQHAPCDEPLTDYVGTPNYVAPEVLLRSYDRSCDIWSIGVFAFAILSGAAPFAGKSNQELYQNIPTAELKFPQAAWKTKISHDAKRFVQACLQKRPSLRPTAQELSQHEWIANRSVPERVDGGKGSRMAKLRNIFCRK